MRHQGRRACLIVRRQTSLLYLLLLLLLLLQLLLLLCSSIGHCSSMWLLRRFGLFDGSVRRSSIATVAEDMSGTARQHDEIAGHRPYGRFVGNLNNQGAFEDDEEERRAGLEAQRPRTVEVRGEHQLALQPDQIEHLGQEIDPRSEHFRSSGRLSMPCEVSIMGFHHTRP